MKKHPHPGAGGNFILGWLRGPASWAAGRADSRINRNCGHQA